MFSELYVVRRGACALCGAEDVALFTMRLRAADRAGGISEQPPLRAEAPEPQIEIVPLAERTETGGCAGCYRAVAEAIVARFGRVIPPHPAWAGGGAA